jgi:hypothetical protein
MLRLATIATLALLAACSHNTDRANPVDPQRTPAVTISLAIEDTTGLATLTWTQYAGVEPLAAYLVLRNVARSTDTDTLARIESIEQTAFVDASLDLETAYQYRVAVLTDAGYTALSEVASFEGFTARPVSIVSTTADSTLGTLRLLWNRYRGPAFISYELHRRETGTDADSVVTVAEGIADTAFVDHTARHGRRYSYYVAVHAGDRTLAGLPVESGAALPSVDIDDLSFDASLASAQARWRPYSGAGFVAYRIDRDEGSGFMPIRTLTSLGDTVLVDVDLHGNTSYSYRVVTLTDAGDELVGDASTGIFHRHLSDWTPFTPGTQVRLQSRSGGGVYAFGTDDQSVRFLEFNGEGRPLLERELLRQPAGPKVQPFLPQSISGRVLPDGSLALAGSAVGSFLLRFDTAGELQTHSVDLFEDIVLPAALPREPRGVISFTSSAIATEFYIDNVSVSVSEAVVYEQGFSDGAPEDWHIITSDGTDNNTTVTRDFSNSRATFQGGDSQVINGLIMAQKVDLTWEDFVLAIDLAVLGGVPGVRIGGGLGSTVHLRLDLLAQQALLHWIHVPRPGTEEDRFEKEFEVSFPIVFGVATRVKVSAGQDAPLVTIESPVQHVIDGTAQYTTVQSIGDVVTFIGGRTPVSLAANGTLLTYAELSEAPSETRIWPSARAFVMGAVFPASHSVSLTATAVNRATGRVAFPGTFSEVLGDGAGQGPGQFLFPLSLDAGLDGRIYVLDAANSRIQVFAADGQYITQWGRFGSGPGEFNFSVAGDATFAGSIAVDDSGFIYVADVGNNRIQKFAP